MDATAERPLGDAEFGGQSLVVLDLVVSFVQKIIENELAFFRRQLLETTLEAFAFLAGGLGVDPHRRDFRRDLLPTVRFPNDIAPDAVEVTAGFAVVSLTNVGQAGYYAVDGLVCEIFSVAEAFRYEHAEEAGANGFILGGARFAVTITQPRQ